MATTTGVVQEISWTGTGACVAIGSTLGLAELFTIQFRSSDSAHTREFKKSMIGGLAKAEIAGLPITVEHADGCGEITSVQLEALKDPALPGPRGVQPVVYAAPGLDYSSNPQLSQYVDFQTPTAGFETRRIDVSAFGDLGFGANWPFDNTAVPINGLLCIPTGDGPFPLALFAHGNHDPLENSTPGYLYLCDLLASHGIIAATIDVNFLNGGNFGENDGRAIVHLEHVKQFRIWNEQPGHALHRKVDLSRVMIVGHSRGGEGVGHASLFNPLSSVQPDPFAPAVPLNGSLGLGPYGFGLRAVAAISPTDGQYVPVSGATKVRDNYFLIHGSRDGDVFTFAGYKTYDRSHAVDLANPTQSPLKFKSLLWVHGANHNFFNSVWAQESTNTITRPQQEQVAKVQLSALAQATLLNVRAYLDQLRDHSLGATENWLPAGVPVVSQFHDPQRLFLLHFEEPGPGISVSAPASGTVDTSLINATKLNFNLGSSGHLFQETHGLQFVWNSGGRRYRVQFDSATLAPGMFGLLAFRVGQSFEANNPAGVDQALSIRVDDGTNAAVLNSATVQRLIFPGTSAVGASPKTVMQTFRIPLAELNGLGLDTTKLSSFTLEFDQTPTGTLYFDDLQLTD
jgi:predicted dienelactone hydrolase